ncbi:hypothetical protein ABTW24_19455 [Sphingobacterium thalpophilum]|uniref:Uncharacterized protein n=1 Tax=Sphingobacterium thalpophilum TaxID=259 RepID=A0ABV4HGX1_9SPHI
MILILPLAWRFRLSEIYRLADELDGHAMISGNLGMCWMLRSLAQHDMSMVLNFRDNSSAYISHSSFSKWFAYNVGIWKFTVNYA